MCLAVPGKIEKIEDEKATVDYGVEKRIAAVVEDIYKEGDYVIVQGGVVVMKIPEEEALTALKTYQENFK